MKLVHTHIFKTPKGEEKVKKIWLLPAQLAFLAGTINSIALLGFHSFVSHISGHATHAAIEISEGKNHVAVTFVFAACFFILGAILTTFLQSAQAFENRTKRFLAPLALELLLLVGCWLTIPWASRTLHPEGFSRIFVNGLSFAMGLQNAMIRRAAGGIVRTTHMTGVATDIGISLGELLLFVFRARKKLSYIEVRNHFVHYLQNSPLTLHLSIFFAFFLGAVAGTAGFLHFSYTALLLPIGANSLILSLELRSHLKKCRANNP